MNFQPQKYASSIMSHSTVIPIDDVRKRCREELKKKQKHQEVLRIRAKAEQGSIRRQRKDNKLVMQEYAGWDDL